MIVKEIKTSMNRYGNYFLMTEAPPEEEQEVEEIQPEEVNPTEMEDEGDFTNVGLNDDVPFDQVTPEEEDDFTNVGLNDGTGETPDPDTEETTEAPTEEPETPQEEENLDGEEADGTEEIPNEDTGDETTDTEGDFTDVGMDEDNGGEEAEGDEDTTATDGTDDAGTTDGENNGEKKGPGLEYDSTRKYILFKEYMSLYNAISNYITKLENNIKDDIQANQIIKEATNRLREIKDLTYDFMTIKFEISSYTQSLVFYQTLIVSVQMVFNLLANIQEEKTKKIQS